MKKPVIGIMGGTFDPIHNGHLIIAETVCNTYGMEKVIFIPSGNPPHKKGIVVTEKEKRYEMVKYAIKDNKKFELCRLELDRKGNTYTIDTVKELKSMYPNFEIMFIMGEDAFTEIKTWKDYEEIFLYTNILIVTRSYNKSIDINNDFRDFSKKIYITRTPFIEISSTEIRKKIQNKESIKYLVPKEVENFILDNKIYIDIENKLESILIDLKTNLKPKRYNHVLGVIEVAKELSLKWNVNLTKAEKSALFHDFAKNMDYNEMLDYSSKNDIFFDEIELNSPELMHGRIAREIAKRKYYIYDEDILNSIEYHTTGRKGMSKLEKIIFLADYIEPNRNFKGVDELRNLAFKNLDNALVKAIDGTIGHLIENGEIIHPRTLEARNYLIEELSKKRGENDEILF